VSDPQIRPIAIALIWKGDALLVEHGFDAVKNERFFRPPGGDMEFGERASETLCRELREELGAELLEPRLVGVLENIFEYEGRPQHEIAFVLEARFADERLYSCAELEIQESHVRVRASWKSLGELDAEGAPLYPQGLRALLAER
jgi:ADP-ribose pyrophosphatase YjhB (NUDIX family)